MTYSTDTPKSRFELAKTIQISALIAMGLILLGGAFIALIPYLIFHSKAAGTYDSYHDVGRMVGYLAIIPANVWLLSFLWSRIAKPFIILLMIVLSVIGYYFIIWLFLGIYFFSVDWFTF